MRRQICEAVLTLAFLAVWLPILLTYRTAYTLLIILTRRPTHLANDNRARSL